MGRTGWEETKEEEVPWVTEECGICKMKGQTITRGCDQTRYSRPKNRRNKAMT